MIIKKLSIVLLILLLAAFCVGIVNLFLLRFESGDIYPAYSSLRADPLGTKAYHDSLAIVDGMNVERNFEPISKLKRLSGSTVFFPGFGDSDWVEEASAATLEAAAASGNRIVLTFNPVQREPSAARGRTVRTPASKKQGDEESESTGVRFVSLSERWGCEVRYHPLQRDADGNYVHLTAMDLHAATDDPQREISWHSALHFVSLDSAWQPRYGTSEGAVIIERKFGAGSIVLCADSYFLSNEALRREAHPALLGWLVGGNRNIVFDETIHGVQSTPGVAGLIRRYRLHGMVASLLLLACLFIWKNATPFVPATTGAMSLSRAQNGRDAAAGLVQLLQRAVPRRKLLAVCFEEWKKSRIGSARNLQERTALAQQVVEAETAQPRGQWDPLAAYQRIAQVLHAGKQGKKS